MTVWMDLQTKDGEWYWIPDKREGYLAAKKIKSSRSSWQFERPDKKREEVSVVTFVASSIMSSKSLIFAFSPRARSIQWSGRTSR